MEEIENQIHNLSTIREYYLYIKDNQVLYENSKERERHVSNFV